MMSSVNARIVAHLSFSFGMTAFVDIEKNFWGKIKDASLGLKLEGNVDASLETSIHGELRFA